MGLRARSVLMVGVVVVGIVGVARCHGSRAPEALPSANAYAPFTGGESASMVTEGARQSAAVTTTPVRGLAAASAAPQTPFEFASDGMPIMGAGTSDSTANGPRHPHPITNAHQRIARENGLLGQLNGAVDKKDPAALRRLLDEYRREFPQDEQQLQSGYQLLADCLEARTAETRTRAERYFVSERGSTLRRYVQRHCLN